MQELLPNADIGWEVAYYIFIPFFVLIANQVPFWLSVIYLLFGANFFLLSWVDNVLIFLIKHWASNLAALIFFWQPVVFLLAWRDDGVSEQAFSEFHLLMMIFSLAFTGLAWNKTMYESVGAIRYLDPSWNEVADGERLWPSIAYGLGLVEKDSHGSAQGA